MTFVSFPNVTAVSANGQFRIEISGTPADDFFRDQSDFVYRLYNSDRLLWEWEASNATGELSSLDDHPHDAWVNDDGWVVVRTHEWFHAGLIVLSPGGEVVLRRCHRRLLDENSPGFLDGEPDEFMGDSSAGPFWARSSIAYFLEHDGRPFWTLRTWWGRRVVIDLARGLFVDAASIDENRARSLEVAHIQSVLAGSVAKLEELDGQNRDEENDREFWSLANPVLAATYQSGWLQSIDSIPYLRRLEALSAIGSSGCGVGWATLHTLPFRQVAKTSLLRMSQEPIWLSHYQFELRSETKGDCPEGERTMFHFPMQVNARNPDLLEPGLTQKETLNRIGAPDFIRDEWEYDFISPGAGLTARIFWDESHLKNLPYEQYKIMVGKSPPRIARVEILSPQWMQITMRDHYITM